MEEIADQVEPISRKEILDYLRNVQKNTEVRARLSGINVWVLLGAISFVAWSLLDEKNVGLSLSALGLAVACCQGLVLIGMINSLMEVRWSQSEVRLRPAWTSSRTILSKLWCVYFFWLGFPFILTGYIKGISVSVALMSVLMAISIVREIVIEKDDVAAMLPKPKIERPSAFVFYFALAASIVWENRSIFQTFENMTRSEVRTGLLLVVLYYLVFLLISNGLTNKLDLWTYDLERDLILGTCTNHKALKIIEHYSLGARLTELVESKRKNVLSAESNLKDSFDRFDEIIGEIEGISVQYQYERKAQFTKMTGPLIASLQEMESAVSKFSALRDKVLEGNKLSKDVQIDKLIADLSGDVKNWDEKIREYKSLMKSYEKRLSLN